ncbi:MAG TPA: adenylate/guanylate cyclase domain-containing protein [Methylomirabilota bacterium]|nr:adenylate/guanylate cyclase domain-containing protein [Methylomirabilota bacterium]
MPSARSAAAVVRQIRLWAGLVLFTYVSLHLLNHSLGLISLDAMLAGQEWFLRLWRSRPGTLALYGAFTVHLLLAYWSLYRRRTLRMPAWEATQLTLGLTIPPLLVWHVVATRLAHEVAGTEPSYTLVVLALWQLDPVAGLRQSVALVIAWLHGCVGLHFWLRLRPWYARVARLIYSGFLLLPVLALLGFAGAGREVARLAQDPAFVPRVFAETRPPRPEQRAVLGGVATGFFWGHLGAIALILAARGTREHLRRRQGIRVGYPDGREVLVPRGFTVLEASRSAGIPHASVCGGRGRCSTCRVRVTRGEEHLPAATLEELRVLGRVGAPSHVRLACQVRPRGDLAVVPLVPAGVEPAEALGAGDHRDGRELTIAVLFADLRGFTRLAERKLPYDVVFILNRYFEAVGSAITDAGGIVNQFTGDGVMALFGVDGGPEAGCRQAVRAAGAMVARVQELSRTLAADLDAALQLGIGIHSGPAVVGRMGYASTTYLTAVGDTVHVAARLEALTKDYGCELVLSEDAAVRAGLEVSDHARHELTVRNREAPLAVFVVPSARRLVERLGLSGDRVVATRSEERG